MRKPIIAGNWKMHKTAGQSVFLVRELVKKLKPDLTVEVVVCPPFIALKSVSTFLQLDEVPVGIGAQNMHWEDEGAFTGEISPTMLIDLQIGYVIVGHSERRHYFSETDEMVNKKVKAAFAHGIKPIMCVGETLSQRQAGKTSEVVQRQMIEGLAGVNEKDLENLIVAYEPVWAIGTGKNATSADANDVIRHIRAIIASQFSTSAATQVRILYGGSVKPENISLFMREPEIDGALVGGASLDAQAFSQIVGYRLD